MQMLLQQTCELNRAEMGLPLYVWMSANRASCMQNMLFVLTQILEPLPPLVRAVCVLAPNLCHFKGEENRGLRLISLTSHFMVRVVMEILTDI